MRIYKVEGPLPESVRLVRAANRNQAIRHAVKNDYRADVATQDELVELLVSGIAVEDVSNESAD
jgi:hypothetical protein